MKNNFIKTLKHEITHGCAVYIMGIDGAKIFAVMNIPEFERRIRAFLFWL